MRLKEILGKLDTLVNSTHCAEIEANTKEIIESYAGMDEDTILHDNLYKRYMDFLEYNNLVECCECGELVEVENASHTHDGYYVCEKCYQEYEYCTCERCGEAMSSNDTTVVDDYNVWCPDCVDSCASWCERCESYTTANVHEVYTHTDMRHSEYWCTTCIEDNDARYCDNCHEWFTSDCGSYDDDYDYWYCDSCYNNLSPDELRNYSYKPEPNFNKTEAEADIDNNNLFFAGVEVEVDTTERKNRNEDIRGLVDILDNLFYYKEDGSLNYGFECVSHPATIDYWLENKDKIKEAFDYLVSKGYRSHETTTCGFHIHMNRSYLGSTKEKQDEVISKILLILESFRKQVERFSRRKDYHWSHFLSDGAVENSYIAEREDIKNTKVIDKVKKQITSRYAVLNLNNTNTIELRVLRGTLNIETFMAGLQFFKNIVDIAKSKTQKQLNGLKWGKIINYNKNFVELKAYNERRGIDNEAILVVTNKPTTLVIGDRVNIVNSGSSIECEAIKTLGLVGKITGFYGPDCIIEYTKKDTERIVKYLKRSGRILRLINSNGRYYANAYHRDLIRAEKTIKETGEQ